MINKLAADLLNRLFTLFTFIYLLNTLFTFNKKYSL